MDDNGTLILALIALVAMSAFFSASETAYTSLNRARLKAMANGGDRRAAKVLALSEDYDRLLSGILVGNNIVNILSASLATVLFVRLIGGAGVSVSTAVMTVVVLMFGEIAPKTIAKDRPEKVALAFYPLLNAILVLLTPIVFLTTCWQKLIYRIVPPSKDRGINEEELITIVEEAENGGEIDKHEGELIRSAIEFNDMTAEDILTPGWTSYRRSFTVPPTRSPASLRREAVPGSRCTRTASTTSWAYSTRRTSTASGARFPSGT